MVFFEKSQPAPKSLAKGLSYNEEDVVERLCQDFKNKCYICEAKALTSINVEHLRPHEGNARLKYNWENLYFSCSHCNNTKAALERNTDFKNVGILDCTCKNDCVDKCISYRVTTLYDPMRVEIKNEGLPEFADDDRVENTIKLLDAVYNGYNTKTKMIEAMNLKKQIVKELVEFCMLIEKFRQSEGVCRSILKRKIFGALKNDSAFTAFKLWIVRDDQKLCGLLKSGNQN